MRQVLILNPKDNIAICLTDMKDSQELNQDNLKLTFKQAIPRGHKVATADIKKGDGIIKYGERMGHATKDICRGEHVHTHNVLGDRLSTETSAN